MKKNRSIRFVFLASLIVAFVLVLVFTLVFGARSQRAHLEEFTHQYVDGLAKSYFDAMNVMMVTGTMHNRELLREKIKAADDIRDIRMIRGLAVTSMFGAGIGDEQPKDELEQKALAGDRVENYGSDGAGRIYTLIAPIVAEKDYQGVDCTSCHGVKEGAVLGAVRVDYSMARSDARLHQQLMISGGAQIAIILLAFIVTAWVINKILIARLHRLHDSMVDIVTNSDLTVQLEVMRNDELGAVSRAFNRMMAAIGHSMLMVMENASKLHQGAQAIADKAEATEQEVLAQKQNTDQVAEATAQLAASALQVKANAATTTEQSRDTAMAATAGEKRAIAAVSGIEKLSGEVQEGAARIQQLNQRTDDVAAVLEVISSIAEQTNLLALNAAIEAARAGEQGRGFAVVADEVRALASRTQDSTGEIRQTIGSLKNEAVECVQIMDQASRLAQEQVESILIVAKELQAIAEQVRGISELNQKVDEAANEQSIVSDTINSRVVEISRSAEQTSDDARETARISEELLAMAIELQDTIGQFRL